MDNQSWEIDTQKLKEKEKTDLGGVSLGTCETKASIKKKSLGIYCGNKLLGS